MSPTDAKADAVDAAAKKDGGALAKPAKPCPELAAIAGADPLPRTEVDSKIRDPVRKHGLYDPADKRTIAANDKLRAVLGRDRCTMFGCRSSSPDGLLRRGRTSALERADVGAE